jgi:hypothetical protein
MGLDVAQLRSLDLSGIVRLPVGLWVDGVCQRDTSLKNLSGHDEELIAEAPRWPSPAARVSALLAATVAGIGQLAPVCLEHVRALTVLDRDILLVFLRKQMFGSRILSTVKCPNESCGKLVDIDFNLDDLPLPDRSDTGTRYTFQMGRKQVTYRLPTGGDQEAVAAAASAAPNEAGRLILQRCMDQFDSLSHAQVAWLSKEMASRDPQLDTDFEAHCPECSSDFTVRFDIQDFLLREISFVGEQLYRQVHTLAWYYHWSEAEIMAMPFQKRHIYLNLLSDVVSELEGVTA